MNKDEQAVAIVAAVVIAVIVAAIVGVTSFRSTETATISGVSWVREIRIDVWATVRHDDWDMPTAGRLISTHREIHHYDRMWVGSHTESYSCGTSNNPGKKCKRTVDDYRSVPDWRTKYVFDLDEWVYKGSLIRQGDDKDVEWADVTDLRYPDGAVKLGDEQIEARLEHYYVLLPDKAEVPYKDWYGFAVGQRVVVQRNAFNGVESVNPVPTPTKEK